MDSVRCPHNPCVGLCITPSRGVVDDQVSNMKRSATDTTALKSINEDDNIGRC